jgi:DNA-binding transcriptional regulator YdaS (Cro superfamily)
MTERLWIETTTNRPFAPAQRRGSFSRRFTMVQAKQTPQSRAFSAWLNVVPKDVRYELCDRLNTSMQVLLHYAKGRRAFSAARAQKIERVVDSMIESGIDVPRLPAASLCAACASCRYANNDR